jgi:hypothetical protein
VSLSPPITVSVFSSVIPVLLSGIRSHFDVLKTVDRPLLSGFWIVNASDEEGTGDRAAAAEQYLSLHHAPSLR